MALESFLGDLELCLESFAAALLLAGLSPEATEALPSWLESWVCLSQCGFSSKHGCRCLHFKTPAKQTRPARALLLRLRQTLTVQVCPVTGQGLESLGVMASDLSAVCLTVPDLPDSWALPWLMAG